MDSALNMLKHQYNGAVVGGWELWSYEGRDYKQPLRYVTASIAVLPACPGHACWPVVRSSVPPPREWTRLFTRWARWNRKDAGVKVGLQGFDRLWHPVRAT